jgi:hypothetical protein
MRCAAVLQVLLASCIAILQLPLLLRPLKFIYDAIHMVLSKAVCAASATKAIAVSARKAVSSAMNWLSKDVPHCIAAAANNAVGAVFRLLPKAVRTAVKLLRWAASSISQAMPCTTWLLVSSTRITWAGFNIIVTAMFKAVHAAASASTAVSTAVKQLVWSVTGSSIFPVSSSSNGSAVRMPRRELTPGKARHSRMVLCPAPPAERNDSGIGSSLWQERPGRPNLGRSVI